MSVQKNVLNAIWQEYVKVIERKAIKQSGGALRRKDTETRRLRTISGDVEFERGRFYYADGREPGTVMVFDSRIGLKSRQQFTSGAQKMYAHVAALAPSYKHGYARSEGRDPRNHQRCKYLTIRHLRD